MVLILSTFVVDLSMTEFISAYHNHTITGDVTGGLIERTRALLDNQIINLEASNFVCRPMFCDDVMQMVTWHNLL